MAARRCRRKAAGTSTHWLPASEAIMADVVMVTLPRDVTEALLTALEEVLK
jgi:hypothetical protein